MSVNIFVAKIYLTNIGFSKEWGGICFPVKIIREYGKYPFGLLCQRILNVLT
jgi:hypothetical protein